MNYQFNEFQLDSTKYQLLKNNVELEIEPKAFNLILFLIKNSQRVVSREEIFDVLWQGQEVLDATLSNHIKIARAALNDNGQLQQVIKTIRGRGYQFIAPIKILDIDSSKDNINNNKNTRMFNQKKRIRLAIWIFIISLCAISAYIFIADNSIKNRVIAVNQQKQQSIAILPFINRSKIPEDSYFTDGFHDDLLTSVSKIKNIKVVSRTSVMQYRKTTKNLQVIAEELGVNFILEGGVQRAGDDIRINVQLIDAKTDQHLWSESYTRRLGTKNILAIQTEITNTIAKELKLLFPNKKQNLPTHSIQALEFYFKAKFVINEKTNSSNRKAITYLNKAIEQDPDFTLAITELASRYLDQILLENKTSHIQTSFAEPLILKAFKLNPMLSQVHRVDAKLKMYQRKFPEAKMAYQKAVTLNPNNVEAIAAFAKYYMLKGNLPKAIVMLSKAVDLMPNDDEIKADLALILMKDNRFNDVEPIIEELIKRKPQYARAYKIQSDLSFFNQHELSKSIKQLHKTLLLNTGYVEGARLISERYIALGENKKAILWLEYFIKLTTGSFDAKSAQARLHLLNNENMKAFNIYFKLAEYRPHYLADLLYVGQKTGSLKIALARCKELSPELFNNNVVIGSRNMETAFRLGLILKQQGASEQGELLLKRSFKIAQRRVNGGAQSQHKDWQTRIQIAMENYKAALDSFKRFVNKGYYSQNIIEHSDYQAIHSFESYKTLVNIMKQRIKKERLLSRRTLKIPLP